MLKKEQFINEHTGEIYLNRIRRLPSSFDPATGYMFWTNRGASRTFHDVPYPKEMTRSEIGAMAILAKCIWSSTNMLGYRGNGGIRPYSPTQLASILGLGVRQTHRFLAKMVRLGMLQHIRSTGKGKNEVQYYVNPIHFCSSGRISLNLYLLFHEQLDPFLPGWVIGAFGRQKEEKKKQEAKKC